MEGSAKLVYLSDLRSPWRRQYLKYYELSSNLGDSFPTLDRPQTPCGCGKKYSPRGSLFRPGNL